MNESAWEQNLGPLLYQLDPYTKKAVRKLKGKKNRKKGNVPYSLTVNIINSTRVVPKVLGFTLERAVTQHSCGNTATYKTRKINSDFSTGKTHTGVRCVCVTNLKSGLGQELLKHSLCVFVYSLAMASFSISPDYLPYTLYHL